MRIIIFSWVFCVFLIGCSSSDNDSSENPISSQDLIGKWKSTKLIFDFNGEITESLVGQENCNIVDSSTLLLAGECTGTEVELCGTRKEFSIDFNEIGTYVRIESNTSKDAKIDADNGCEITYFKDDSFINTAKGTWLLREDSSEIVFNETYVLIELVNYGEDYEREEFDGSEIIWKILSYSGSEMTIFWRTPDEFDVEITFKKS